MDPQTLNGAMELPFLPQGSPHRGFPPICSHWNLSADPARNRLQLWDGALHGGIRSTSQQNLGSHCYFPDCWPCGPEGSGGGVRPGPEDVDVMGEGPRTG